MEYLAPNFLWTVTALKMTVTTLRTAWKNDIMYFICPTPKWKISTRQQVSVLKICFYIQIQQNQRLHLWSAANIHYDYQCLEKLLHVLFDLSSKLSLCSLGLPLSLSCLSPPVKCLPGPFRSHQQSRAVVTLSISVSLKEWTVYSLRLSISFPFFFFSKDNGKAQRTWEEGLGTCGSWDKGVNHSIITCQYFFFLSAH